MGVSFGVIYKILAALDELDLLPHQGVDCVQSPQILVVADTELALIVLSSAVEAVV